MIEKDEQERIVSEERKGRMEKEYAEALEKVDLEERRRKIREEYEEQLKYEKTVYWWMGKLSELLSDVENDRVELYQNPACQLSRLCQLWGALQYTATIKDCLPILHGPIGCANTYKQLWAEAFDLLGIPPTTVPTTAMNEHDVIFGGEEKLRKAIKLADKVYKPKLIAILTGCAAGIIGDDIDAVIRSVQGEVNATVYPVHSEGFAYRNSGLGIDNALMGLVEYVIEKPDKKIPNSVNIWGEKFAHTPGFAYPSDPYGLIKTFEEMGIKVNAIITGGSTAEDIAKAARAELNVCRCVGNSVRSAKYMEERFGVPWVAPPVPEGIGATSEWFRQAAAFFGDEIKRRAEKVIQRKEKEAWDKVRDFLPLFKGKKAAVWTQPGRGPSIAAACADFSMEVTDIEIGYSRERTLYNLKWFHETYGQDPQVIIEPSLYEEIRENEEDRSYNQGREV